MAGGYAKAGLRDDCGQVAAQIQLTFAFIKGGIANSEAELQRRSAGA